MTTKDRRKKSVNGRIAIFKRRSSFLWVFSQFVQQLGGIKKAKQGLEMKKTRGKNMNISNLPCVPHWKYLKYYPELRNVTLGLPIPSAERVTPPWRRTQIK